MKWKIHVYIVMFKDFNYKQLHKQIRISNISVSTNPSPCRPQVEESFPSINYKLNYVRRFHPVDSKAYTVKFDILLLSTISWCLRRGCVEQRQRQWNRCRSQGWMTHSALVVIHHCQTPYFQYTVYDLHYVYFSSIQSAPILIFCCSELAKKKNENSFNLLMAFW